jgi:hypothetical protein
VSQSVSENLQQQQDSAVVGRSREEHLLEELGCVRESENERKSVVV